MTTSTESPEAVPAGPAPSMRPRLERSLTDRYVGGVCGGLGRYFDIDPIVFRVAFACFAVFGAGLFAYAAAWLFIPDEGAEHSLAQSARHDQRPRREIFVIGFVVIAGLVMVNSVFGRHNGDNGWVFPVFAIGAFLWWRHERHRPMDGAAAGPSWPAVPPSWPDAPPPPVAPPAPSAFWSNTATTAPAAPLDPSATASASAWLAPARPPKPRRERSHLGLLTFSALLVAVGVATLLDAAGTVDLSLQAGLAVALLVVGAGLIAGAWYGRSRGLIALGLLLTLLASFVSIVDVPMRGGTGDVTWRLTSADELAAGYHLRAGSAVLDLTAVPFGEQVRTVDASVGFGQLTVVVPDGVSVRVTGHIGAGDALIFGQQQNGFDLDIDSADDPAPQLVVTTHIGFGELQVRHVAS